MNIICLPALVSLSLFLLVAKLNEGAQLVRSPRDEFNLTENPISFVFSHASALEDQSHDQQQQQQQRQKEHKRATGRHDDELETGALELETIDDFVRPRARQLFALRHVLMEQELGQCCPEWRNLSTRAEIVNEIKAKVFHMHDTKKAAKAEASNQAAAAAATKFALKAHDLINELKQTLYNMTQLSIDGQPGSSEQEKYYRFHDSVQYFSRLVKVTRSWLAQNSTPFAPLDDANYIRQINRQLNGLLFRLSQDEFVSEFTSELLCSKHRHFLVINLISLVNCTSSQEADNFDTYESFITKTQFGQNYARNISLVRKSVHAFDRIYSQLATMSLYSNLTKPSQQYQQIKRMSSDLFRIRHDLIQQVSLSVLANRQDVQKSLAKLEELVQLRPEIRMLGDSFADQHSKHLDSIESADFSAHVSQLTQALDLYTNNNLTQMSFYQQLAELPEDFILLGATVAHEYENKEVPQYSRFNLDHYLDLRRFSSSGAGFFGQQQQQQQFSSSSTGSAAGDKNATTSIKHADARQSSQSIFSKLFN